MYYVSTVLRCIDLAHARQASQEQVAQGVGQALGGFAQAGVCTETPKKVRHLCRLSAKVI